MSSRNSSHDDRQAVEAIRHAALPLNDEDGHEALLHLIGDARFVLLGEASHGTHEFYRERARITQALIERKGFQAVAIEGDWPDTSRVNRFVRGLGGDAFAGDALGGFRRFPTWMWRNTDVVDFVDWLRARNEALPPDARAGVYGIDLYSLHASMEAVVQHLDRHDPTAARRARERYACFDRFGDDSQLYGLMTGVGSTDDCGEQVVTMLREMTRRHQAAAARAGAGGAELDEAFDAEQNARLVRNAEEYYRTMYWREVSSWNLRDSHMAEALMALDRHFSRRGPPARIVVWAHNSHLGDARATEMGRQRGELNVGQLVREQYGREAVLVGFSTHQGTVTAASDWDGQAERKTVLPSRADSHEHLMHETGLGRFLLPLRDDDALAHALRQPRLQRAIGVIYRPDTERQSHYFQAWLADQFDALIHIDTTRAVQPLERSAQWHGHEAPETFPAGL